MLYIVVPPNPDETFTLDFPSDVEAEAWFGNFVYGCAGRWALLRAEPSDRPADPHRLAPGWWLARQHDNLYDVRVRAGTRLDYCDLDEVVVVEIFPGMDAGYEIHGKSVNGRFTDYLLESDASNRFEIAERFVRDIIGRAVPIREVSE